MPDNDLIDTLIHCLAFVDVIVQNLSLPSRGRLLSNLIISLSVEKFDMLIGWNGPVDKSDFSPVLEINIYCFADQMI